jgi:hypothetical protein
LAPLVNLTLARVTLNLWDGYQVGLGDFSFALGKYLVALYIAVLVAILGLFVCLLFFMAGLPIGLIHGLASGAGLPRPLFAILSLFGIGVGLLVFVRHVWPTFRRYIFLNFVALFALSEGQPGPWAKKLAGLFRLLRSFPSHLNQAIVAFLVAYLALFVAITVLAAILSLAGFPSVVISLVAQFVFLLAISWLLVALSGFYRLFLAPEPETGPPVTEPSLTLEKG